MNRSLKRLVRTTAEHAGYTIIPNWQIETFAGIRHAGRLFELLSIDLVLDVGGNAGQFHDSLRSEVGYQGRIITFEPVPHLGRLLAERAVSDPLWTIEPRALGATVGSIEFNVMEDTQFSSFLNPLHNDVSLFVDQNRIRERVPVEVTTLDAILPSIIANFAPRAIYLKLDTQGYEIEILKGAAASLEKICAFQSEVSFRSIYEGAPDYSAVIAYAVNRGFVISGLFQNNVGHFPQLVDFDCYLIRKEFGG